MGSKFYSSSSFYSGLSHDLSLMLNESDANDYNVIIKTGENMKLRAHSNILKARSPYLKRAFLAGLITKNNDNMIEINKPNINPTVFEIILKYAIF